MKFWDITPRKQVNFILVIKNQTATTTI